jgi:D-3-phosphoglycerate dehydrogenase
MFARLCLSQLKEEEVAPSVRCIVRCGAGTNNIPVERMTELGIPVFNTPGANANAVKELVVCSLLLASRGILEGNNHVNNVINVEENMDYDKIAKRIEKDKAKFVGNEIAGKTLGVVGLGAIGGMVVTAGLNLGMKVVGFDPALSMEAAWKLPGDRMTKAKSFEDLLKVSDFVTFHVPYIKSATHHMLNGETLQLCKPGVHLLNFARGEIIDGEALKDMWRGGRMTGKNTS